MLIVCAQALIKVSRGQFESIVGGINMVNVLCLEKVMDNV
jgi:hypothetical protein